MDAHSTDYLLHCLSRGMLPVFKIRENFIVEDEESRLGRRMPEREL